MGLFCGLTPVHRKKQGCQPNLIDAQPDTQRCQPDLVDYLRNKWLKMIQLICDKINHFKQIVRKITRVSH